ncbi:hypothetical protein WJX74_010180 [Apatococcus lobatus]|uniref:Uncharacterized protein n=1 Tax=Apatococcus lobatus TaxID=904363 RepID=A0AAW1RCC1_9CHLO
MATLPNFELGPLPLGLIREEGRRQLLDALDTRRGKKVLVLDPRISGFLRFVAEVPLLREHGVEQLVLLDTNSLAQNGIRSVVYLVRATIDNAQTISKQIRNTAREAKGVEFGVFFLPARSHVCEKVFAEEGVFGDIHIGDYPLNFIPFDSDILSLELPSSFKDVVVDGDKTSLHAVASALLQLQAMYGAPSLIRGKGPGAAVVKDMLVRMQQELGSQAPVPGEGAIDTLLLLDRELDPITPLMTQLTYEGLVDELLGISNGTVQFDVNGGQRQKFALNSSDQVFHELRDLSFAAVGPELGKRTKGLRTDYQGTKGPDRSIAELKQFTSQLKSLPHITRHINMAEAVSTQMRRRSLRARVHVEQLLVDGRDVESCCENIEEMMCSGMDLLTVLRLLCLVSLTQGGIPKRHCDGLRREVLHTYGHEHVLTLASLQAAGLLKRQEGARSNFAAVRKAFRLLVEGLDDAVVPPLDAAYTYSGYCPLTARLAESALRPQGWTGLEDALRLLPGPHFEVKPTAYSQEASPAETPEPATPAAAASGSLGLLSRPGSGTGMGGGAGAFANLMRLGSSFREAPSTGATSKQHKTVLVVFIGGVTFAEIAALRWMASRPGSNCNIVIATTKLINGNTFLSSFIDGNLRQGMAESV